MSALSAAFRIPLLVFLAGVIGAIYGYALEAILIALSVVIVFWLYQMQRIRAWLNDPKQAPPDASGMWGDLLTRLYSQQRQHQEVQAKLQSAVAYLQDSFAAIRDGVVMVDEQGIIKWLNKAAEPLLGLRFPEDRGQTLTNLVREPAFNSYFLSRNYTEPLQYRTARDSEQAFVRVEITYFGEGNRVLFLRDVSQEVRMEQMRRDFVANVSHELRTPLTVISGYLGTILANSQDIPERYLKPLKQMAQQAQRMEGLIRDLLWLSRIESEKHQESNETVDIRSLLQELRDELREAYPQSPVQLDIGSEQSINGNYQKLYSAVSNLAINAIKYSDPGSPVTISWQVEGDIGLLSVEDRGVGIDSVHIPRLTERFYRVDDSRNTSTGGTGLGLAIVKHVAAAHGAKLQIESKLGEGSTFTLVFPLRGEFDD